MLQQRLAPHESVELHEILTFKNVSLTKSIMMKKLVSDEELKSILQKDAAAAQRHIEELKRLMEQPAIYNING